MSKTPREPTHPPAGGAAPVNLIDGIPDRSARPAAWKYALIAAVFLAWLTFLIYCALAGRVGQGAP